MGDHFVLMVDRLLTESTLDATIAGGNNGILILRAEESDVDAEIKMEAVHEEKDCGDGRFGGEVVECRICQEEEEICNMESPCSCSGSLKYAHRKCVQRWCYEKGDTTCEICLQPLRPGYMPPPQLFRFGRVPLDFRGNWEISRQELNNARSMAGFTRDGDYPDGNYDDCVYPSDKSLLICCVFAMMFLILLLLRHILPIILIEDEDALEEFSLLAMRVLGVLFPIYIIVRTLSIFYIRCHRQGGREMPVSASERENENERPSPMQQSWWQMCLMRIRGCCC